MTRLTDAISHLEYTLRLWKEDPDVRKSDIRFLESRLEKLRKLRKKVEETIQQIVREVDERFD